MSLQTAEIGQFSALMLIPPGNIQVYIEQSKQLIKSHHALLHTTLLPNWLFLGWLEPLGNTLDLQAAARQMPDQAVVDTWHIKDDAVFLSAASLTDGVLTINSQAEAPFVPRTIFCGWLPDSSDKHEVVKTLPQLSLKFRSAQLARVSFNWRLQHPLAASWRIEESRHIRLNQSLPYKKPDHAC